MAERKLLELAPGSRWVDDEELVDDCSSKHTIVSPVNERAYLISVSRFGMTGTAYTDDAIALLHRAGLLDGLLAEAWDDGASEAFDKADGIGCSAVALEKFYASNPYRKAGENGQ